jgi:hypothetical protein
MKPMKMPQFSIAGLMAVVCSVATTIAGARAVYAYHPASPTFAPLLLGVPLIAFAVQLGLWRAVRGRGRARDFWAGFVAFGFLSAGTFAAAFIWFPESMETPLFVWGAYYELMGVALFWVLPSWLISQHPLVWTFSATALLFLPQIIIASTGGLLTQRLSPLVHPDLGREARGTAGPSNLEAPTISG